MDDRYFHGYEFFWFVVSVAAICIPDERERGIIKMCWYYISCFSYIIIFMNTFICNYYNPTDWDEKSLLVFLSLPLMEYLGWRHEIYDTICWLYCNWITTTFEEYLKLPMLTDADFSKSSSWSKWFRKFIYVTYLLLIIAYYILYFVRCVYDYL